MDAASVVRALSSEPWVYVVVHGSCGSQGSGVYNGELSFFPTMSK